ncbi:hypothetical protein [Shivajiella indica]|uniref:Uncharacterized protein n=1 Tax=Shivajiella indica TaxID=872115 RepID=A0ABW5BAL1_9BACT
MGFLLDKCTFSLLNREVLNNTNHFDCGHQDLNDFFKNDVLDYSSQLLGKSYCFLLDQDPKTIVCAFSISNDSIKVNFLPNNSFKFLFGDEAQEGQYTGIAEEKPVKTRLMYYDLIELVAK